MGMRPKIPWFSLLFLGLMFWSSSICLGADAKTFLAIEVRVQGDAGAWRWWCDGADDPLVIKAWRGFWTGFSESSGTDVVSQLQGRELEVHPMYCRGDLDAETAQNLAGLFGAEHVRVGVLEISEVQSFQEPHIYSVVLRYRESSSGAPSGSGKEQAKHTGAKVKPLWAERNVTAPRAIDLPDQVESGGRELALQVRQLSLQSEAAARRLRAQIFVVRGLTHEGADRWLVDRLKGILPSGIKVEAEGYRGQDGIMRISAPRSNQGDLVELMRSTLASDDRSEFLSFEGTTAEGLPVFAANGVPLPPWAPKPPPVPEPDSDSESEPSEEE